MNGGNPNTSYSTRTSSEGWTATNAALVKIGDYLAPTLNGKTSAVGVITSPTLSGGLGTITFNYQNTFSESNGVSVKIEVKQNNEVVATQTLTTKPVTQNTEYTFTSEDFNVEGEFVIVITNLSPSNSTSNKDRVSIYNLSWTNYPDGEAPAVETPVIMCLNNEVSITCPTPGADIFYTVDGTEPTNDSQEYEDPFTITKNTTVKAIAYVGDQHSAVRTYNAVYEASFSGFADMVSGGSGTTGKVQGPITAVYQNGQYLYMVDSSDYPMLVYGGISQTLTNGTQVAYVEGKYSPYNNLPEVTDPVVGDVVATGTPVAPRVITAAECTNDLINRYVELQNMTLVSATSASDASGSVVLYSRFSSVQIPTSYNKNYTIRGFVSIFGTTIQLYPTEFIEVGNYTEDPVFNPKGGAVEAGTQVSISCATPGATIYYTTDGTEPSNTSTLYEGPITVDQAMTISAIAYAAGMDPSSVVSATYTLVDPNQATADFPFNDESWVSGQGVTLPTTASTGTDIAGRTFTSGIVTVEFAENSNNTKARIWRMTNGNIQLRTYKSSDLMTVSVPQGYKLTSITFVYPGASSFGLEPSTGTLTSGTWIPSDETAVESVAFSFTVNSQITSFEVSYDKSSGVSDVIDSDDNAPVEFYNLQGVRVVNPENGIYIRRQGNTVSKVLVK